MMGFLDKMTKTESNNIDMLLAEFFFACNVPFHSVDSQYFKKLVSALRPSYTPPNRKRLAESLLEKEHSKMIYHNEVLIMQMNKQAALLIDGWTNSSANRHYLVCMLATADNHKVFLEAFDISETGEKSEQLVEIVQKAIALAKEKYDCEVFSLVSDNAPNMTCTGRQLEPELMYTTCNSHTANLLAKDLIGIKKNDGILAKIMKTQKEFRKPGLESQLTKAGGKKPVLYSVIRFASARNAIQSFLENVSFMKKVCADGDNDEDDSTKHPDPSVAQLLFNVSFVDSAKNLLSSLDPIAKLINVCQKSNVSVADAVEEWFDSLAEAQREIKPLVEARVKKSKVFNDVSMAANYFHPVYRGRKLSDSQRKEVDDYIFIALEANALESCRLFKTDEGTFAALKRKKILTPNTYWYYAQQQGHDELAVFAMKLLKIPASTCQLERLFSNWSFIHTETRNRLLPERSKMLMNIYFTLRSCDVIEEEEDSDEQFNA